MAITYAAVIDSANVKLRNTTGSNWDDPTMLDLLNDTVQLMLHALGIMDPDQFAATYTIPLLTATGYGPYDLPAAMKYPVKIEDDQTPAQELTRINRSISNHASETTRPYTYWLQGRGPTKIYFGSTPDANRNYTLYYIPSVARQTDEAQNIPLEDYCFEPLVQALIKFAGNIDEYTTMDEDAKLQIMSALVIRITMNRVNSVEVSFRGSGLGRSGGKSSGFRNGNI